jgi:hypothetical protein
MEIIVTTDSEIARIDTDIDRLAGRIRVHRAFISALMAIIATHHPQSFPAIRNALHCKPSEDPRLASHPAATIEAIDDEVALLLKWSGIDAAAGG